METRLAATDEELQTESPLVEEISNEDTVQRMVTRLRKEKERKMREASDLSKEKNNERDSGFIEFKNGNKSRLKKRFNHKIYYSKLLSRVSTEDLRELREQIDSDKVIPETAIIDREGYLGGRHHTFGAFSSFRMNVYLIFLLFFFFILLSWFTNLVAGIGGFGTSGYKLFGFEGWEKNIDENTNKPRVLGELRPFSKNLRIISDRQLESSSLPPPGEFLQEIDRRYFKHGWNLKGAFKESNRYKHGIIIASLILNTLIIFDKLLISRTLKSPINKLYPIPSLFCLIYWILQWTSISFSDHQTTIFIISGMVNLLEIAFDLMSLGKLETQKSIIKLTVFKEDKKSDFVPHFEMRALQQMEIIHISIMILISLEKTVLFPKLASDRLSEIPTGIILLPLFLFVAFTIFRSCSCCLGIFIFFPIVILEGGYRRIEVSELVLGVFSPIVLGMLVIFLGIWGLEGGLVEIEDLFKNIPDFSVTGGFGRRIIQQEDDFSLGSGFRASAWIGFAGGVVLMLTMIILSYKFCSCRFSNRVKLDLKKTKKTLYLRFEQGDRLKARLDKFSSCLQKIIKKREIKWGTDSEADNMDIREESEEDSEEYEIDLDYILGIKPNTLFDEEDELPSFRIIGGFGQNDNKSYDIESCELDENLEISQYRPIKQKKWIQNNLHLSGLNSFTQL